MIKYLTPVPKRLAAGLVLQVYDQMERDFGALVEPLTLHSPVPALLTAVWVNTREVLLTGRVRREVKEAIATTVSRTNQCPYCADSHAIMLSAASSHSLAQAVSDDRDESIADEEVRAVLGWVKACWPLNGSSLPPPPFPPQDLPEIIGVILDVQYINRIVNVFLDESPIPVEQKWLKELFALMASWKLSRAVNRPKPLGEALGFLPDAPLPADFNWAESNPMIAGAYARGAAVIEQLGETALAPELRRRVLQHINEWTGEAPGLSRAWVEPIIEEFDAPTQAAGRLVLLTALASYQVDERIIREFRAYFPEEGQLLSAVAWASFAVARRIAAVLAAATPLEQSPLFKASLAHLQSVRAQTMDLIEDLSPAQLDFSSGAGKPSVGGVVDHLLLGEKFFRGEIAQLIELKRAGQPPEVKRAFGDLNIPLTFIPKSVLPFTKLPLVMIDFFVPDFVKGFLFRSPALPEQNSHAVTRQRRPATELRHELSASVKETAALLEANPDLDYRAMIHKHPLLGENSALGLLRILSLYEQRCQSRIKDVLADPLLPGNQ